MPADRRTVRRFAFCSCSVLTVSFLATTLVFTSVDSINKNGRSTSLRSLAAASSAFNGISLCLIFTLVTSRLVKCRNDRFFRWILPWIGATASVIAAIITLNLLLGKAHDSSEAGSNTVFRIDTTAEFAIWSINCIFQLCFYAMISLLSLLPNPSPKADRKSSAPQRPPTPPTPLRIISSAFVFPPSNQSEDNAAEPSPSRFSAESRRTPKWRDSLHSLHNVVRPITSRSRLIASTRTSTSNLSRDSQSLQSDARSIRTPPHSDTFDAWSSGAPSISSDHHTTPPSASSSLNGAAGGPIPSKGTALEPIPGSRPVSPATALNGPFPDVSSPPSPSPPSPDRPGSALSRSSTTARLDRPPTLYSLVGGNQGSGSFSRKPPIPRRTSSPPPPPPPPQPQPPPPPPLHAAGDSPASPATSQSHIHPLFRTDSPTPPPNTSPGTVVVASPFSGQVINAPGGAAYRARMRSDSRVSVRTARSDSRAASCASRSRPASRTASRAGSMERGRGGVLAGQGQEQGSLSRSVSPPASRVGTPPIPEFVLGVSRERVI